MILPNVVVNGDFSLGFAGWTHGGGAAPVVVPACTLAQGAAALYFNDPAGRFSRQIVATPPAQAYKLEVEAQILNGPATTGTTRVSLQDTASAGLFVMVGLEWQGEEVRLRVSDALGVGAASAPAPTDHACHRYEAYVLWALAPADRQAWLLVDGVPTLHATGTFSAPLADTLVLGDTEPTDAAGPAPTALYDDVRFGPWI